MIHLVYQTESSCGLLCSTHGLHYRLLSSTCQPLKLNLVSFRIVAQKWRVKNVFYDKYVELCAMKNVSPTAAAREIGLSNS